VNMRNEIPQRAFINAQILQLAEKVNDWGKAVDSIAKSYSLGQYEFKNSAYVASLLYCLLVVPKEIWIQKNRCHAVFNKIDHDELKKRIEYTSPPDFDADFAYNLIHKLRNAVAHANYEVDENMNFEFWNINDGNNENFRCKINAENLMWLLSVIGAELANLRTQA